MLFRFLLDLIFSGLYGIIDWLSSYFTWVFDVPDSIYTFLTDTFTLLSFFVPFVSLMPLLYYHACILGLRLFLMILGLIKRIPLA